MRHHGAQARTKDLRGKAADNMGKLEETLALQRRLIAATLNSGQGMGKLEKEMDAMATDMEVSDNIPPLLQNGAKTQVLVRTSSRMHDEKGKLYPHCVYDWVCRSLQRAWASSRSASGT